MRSPAEGDLHMRSTGRRKPYSGILTTPLPVFVTGLLASKEEMAVADAKMTDELDKRWQALCAHYELPIWDSAGVALALAVEHVQGFQPAPRREKRRGRGQPPSVPYYAIGIEVLQLVADGLTKEEAYRTLAKRKTFGKLSVASIKRHFKEIQRRTKTEADRREFLREMTKHSGWWGEK